MFLFGSIDFEGVERGWLWLLLTVAIGWALYATYRGIFLRTERRLETTYIAIWFQ